MFAETLAVVHSISYSTQTAQSKNAASEPDVTRSQRVGVYSPCAAALGGIARLMPCGIHKMAASILFS